MGEGMGGVATSAATDMESLCYRFMTGSRRSPSCSWRVGSGGGILDMPMQCRRAAGDAVGVSEVWIGLATKINRGRGPHG